MQIEAANLSDLILAPIFNIALIIEALFLLQLARELSTFRLRKQVKEGGRFRPVGLLFFQF